MSWQIQVPHRDRDESLIDVASHCRHLGDDAAVMRQVVFDAQIDRGLDTAGELLDELGAATPDQRRAMLDQARAVAGMESIADIEAGERVRLATEAARRAAEPALTLCHGKRPDGTHCNAIPTRLGVPVQINAVRWFCDEHIGQARPGDMDPKPPPWRYSESGAIVPNEPAADQAREEAMAESRRRRHEAALAERAVEAEALEEHRRARDEQLQRELPAHLRTVA